MNLTSLRARPRSRPRKFQTDSPPRQADLLIFSRYGWVWKQERRLGARHAADVLLHEMIHVALFAHDIPNTKEAPHHNAEEWCAEIVRITPQLGLPAVTAAPVKPRRVDGKVVRQALEGHLSRDDVAHWPHSIRPAGFYDREGRITVPI
jgi:hypothetical protein